MRYYVEMQIDFSGWIEADSEEEAEKLAYDNWGDTMDCLIVYDGVHSITVEEEPEPEFDDEEEEAEDAE